MEMSRLSQTEGVSTSIKCRQCGYRPYLLIFNENGNASRHPYLSVSVCDSDCFCALWRGAQGLKKENCKQVGT